MSGKPLTLVGADYGESTTIDITAYNFTLFSNTEVIIFDSMGLNDTRLLRTNS